MGLTNSRDTTLTRLRVQPIDGKAQELAAFGLSPQALTLMGLFQPAVATTVTVAAGASGNVELNAAALPDGDYWCIEQGFLATSGVLSSGRLSFSGGITTLAVYNTTAAGVTFNAGETEMVFLVFRVEAD